mmetsp:Transcript_125115/g.400723  ORF Transcript_125115/g.400723 Transcript_125115/m.400723 type:complete len:489 (-) Transcript_125115:104-1570(-)
MALEGLWYIGVALEIFSTMTGTIGKQLIRMSEILKRRKPRVSSMCFRLGLIINTVVGPVVDMGAYSFANQSLIAPFGGLDVVWNAMLAPWVLGEKMTKSRGVGCVLILFGTIMAGIFGNHVEPEYTIEYIQDTLLAPRVGIYFACFMAWFFFNRFYLMRKPAGSALRGISLGCTAGTIAGNMFCVKASIELIQLSIMEQAGDIWSHWLPYVLLVGAAFFALSNVIYMTIGLQEYEALFMVTIYEGSMIVSGCISGSIVLLDLRGLAYWRVGLYFGGVFTVVVGMVTIFMAERSSHSSLAAGSASLEEGELARRTGAGGIIGELDDRTIHATFSPSPERNSALSSPGLVGAFPALHSPISPSASAGRAAPSPAVVRRLEAQLAGADPTAGACTVNIVAGTGAHLTQHGGDYVDVEAPASPVPAERQACQPEAPASPVHPNRQACQPEEGLDPDQAELLVDAEEGAAGAAAGAASPPVLVHSELHTKLNL